MCACKGAAAAAAAGGGRRQQRRRQWRRFCGVFCGVFARLGERRRRRRQVVLRRVCDDVPLAVLEHLVMRVGDALVNTVMRKAQARAPGARTLNPTPLSLNPTTQTPKPKPHPKREAQARCDVISRLPQGSARGAWAGRSRS